MTRGYVHIGMPKTGSTTIQTFLYRNYGLLRRTGYLYPLSVISHSPHDHEHRLLVRPLPKLMGRLRREIAKNPGLDVILSQENLAVELPRRGQLAEFRDFLYGAGLSEITVIIYLRDIGEMLTSMCCESMKFGLDLTRVAPQDALSVGINLDYRDVLEHCGSVFGQERLQVRLFSGRELQGGDLLRDFVQAAGMDWDQGFAIPARQKEALSLLEMVLLSSANRLLGPDADTHRGRALKRRAFARLHSLLPEDSSGGLRYAAPDQLRRTYCAYFARSNQWVCDRFFPGRAELFPASDQASYREHCQLTQMTQADWDALTGVLLDLARETRRPVRLPSGEFRQYWLKRLRIWRELYLPRPGTGAR